MLAKIVGSGGQVVALEANPHNAKIGKFNRELNGVQNLEILDAAAADRSGTLTFNMSLNGAVDACNGKWGQRIVPSLSVDDLAARYGMPDLVFIDVEGFETKVMEGATQTLRHRPDFFIEVHVGCGLETFGFSAESIISFFSPEEYRLFVAGQNESTFHELESDICLPQERFFLIAADWRQGIAQ